MIKTIVALDPGGTTGFAKLVLDTDDSEHSFTPYDFETGQIEEYEHHAELYTLLEDSMTEDYTIVTESFEYRNRARPGLELVSREYIGVAKLFMELQISRNGVLVEFEQQTAAQGKGFVKDENIKKLGLWSLGNKHAMDAMRHLLYYIIHTDPYCKQSKYSLQLLQHGWK